MKISLNEWLWAKLTPKGERMLFESYLRSYQKQCNEVLGSRPNTSDNYTFTGSNLRYSKVWIRFKLWDAKYTFGKILFAGGSLIPVPIKNDGAEDSATNTN